MQCEWAIHSGPVSEVTDVSGRANIAGAGINVAQRVMDCGDAGHILLSKRVAEDLEQYGHWKSQLHDLGECEVKHGVRLGVVNLCGDGVGNPQLPEKVPGAQEATDASALGNGGRSVARARRHRRWHLDFLHAIDSGGAGEIDRRPARSKT